MGRQRVDAAMRRVARAGFLPEGVRDWAHRDEPLPIGHGGTNSQPTTVRNMLMLLDAQPGHRVLDVGAGSGWTTALLADLVGPSGAVVATEWVPQLADFGNANLTAAGLEENVRIEVADRQIPGCPGRGPYDRILVSAMADRLPELLVDQLMPGGVMVIPVASVMLRVERTADGVRTSQHGLYRFVPLLGSERKS